jgi:uncharacterized protein with HEPN domain
MSKRFDTTLLSDIILNLEMVLQFSQEHSFQSFSADIKTQYACDRCFEIIGEASRSLSEEFVLQHGNIEWNKLIAFRNVLIHEYFRVDRNIQWNIIQNTLPALLTEIKIISL